MMHKRSFRLLACEFHVATNCELFAKQLEYLAVNAVQAYPLSAEKSYEVLLGDGTYRIYEDGECLCFAHSPEHALELIYPIVHKVAYDLLPDYIRIHSGCVTINGKRLLMVGNSGVGKTTLMLHLLYAGFEVQGDETVLLMDGEAIPFPRRFHIKQASIDLLPQASIISDLPFLRSVNDGSKIYAFDPADMGFSWPITRAPVDAIFHVEANHGGATKIERCPTVQMAQNLLPQVCVTDGIGRSGLLRDTCAMVDTAECYTLTLGGVDDVIVELKRRFG